MFRSISMFRSIPRLGRWCCTAAVVAGLGLSGCRTLDYSDYDLSHLEELPCAPPSNWTGDLRRPDAQRDFFGVSNEARQIERDFGVGGGR